MKKRTLTLLEVMIVIFLITIITGAIGYNLKGSLDKGRVFKTKQGMPQLHDLLLLYHEEHPGVQMQNLAQEPQKYLKELGLAKDVKSLVVDGWGEPYKITVSPDGSDFDIQSNRLTSFEAKNK